MTAKLAINTVAAVAMVASMSVALADEERQEDLDPDAFAGLVRDVHQAANRFQDVNAATAEGYVSTASCVSGPNQGAMGVHYVNGAFIEDGVLDVRRPEVLVYEPHERGLRLVAVEFLVDAQQWDAANPEAPVIGGQLLNYVGAPNRLRLRTMSFTSGPGREIPAAFSPTGIRRCHARGTRERVRVTSDA
jgi:hypothetical protein